MLTQVRFRPFCSDSFPCFNHFHNSPSWVVFCLPQTLVAAPIVLGGTWLNSNSWAFVSRGVIFDETQNMSCHCNVTRQRIDRYPGQNASDQWGLDAPLPWPWPHRVLSLLRKRDESQGGRATEPRSPRQHEEADRRRPSMGLSPPSLGAAKNVHWTREPTVHVTKTVCDRNFVLKCETKQCEIMFILLTVNKV